MTLQTYIKPLQKWWWLILLTVAISAGTAFFVVRQLPPVYRATTTLIIGQAITDPNPTGNEIQLGRLLAITYSEIARRDIVQDGVRSDLGIAVLPDYSVNVLPSSQLIEISVVSQQAGLARDVAQSLADQLILNSPSNSLLSDDERQAFVGEQLGALETQIAATTSEVDRLTLSLTTLTESAEIQAIQTQIRDQNLLLTTLQSNYASLLASTAQGATNSLSVLEPAKLPQRPLTRNMTIVAIAGLLSGLLAVGTAFLLETLDDKIRNRDDVKLATDLPILSEIGKFSADASSRLITIDQPRSPIAESFRFLRTGIQFTSVDVAEKSFVVTSSTPGEGKSTTIANLAIVTAQAGHRVLLIDADLRRPIQHRIHGLADRRLGLTNLIINLDGSSTDSDNINLDEFITTETKVQNLHVLTSGPIPPNPSELLGSEKMREVLSLCCSQYDFVFVDSPPVLVVTDAIVLSSLVGSTILVAQAGQTTRKQLAEATTKLTESRANLIGLTLNQISRQDDAYSYYYITEDEDAEFNVEKLDSSGKPPLRGIQVGHPQGD